MKENFRQFLDRLRQAGELVDLHQAVDIRHIATLVDQAKTALYFHNVIGYDVPVVSGIIRSKERATLAMGCETFGEIEFKLAAAIAKPIPVFPDVASSRVSPGDISPRSSAPRIMLIAGRSLTEPAGLFPSSLASSTLPRRSFSGPGRRCRHTRGVSPMTSSIVGYAGGLLTRPSLGRRSPNNRSRLLAPHAPTERKEVRADDVGPGGRSHPCST